MFHRVGLYLLPVRLLLPAALGDGESGSVTCQAILHGKSRVLLDSIQPISAITRRQQGEVCALKSASESLSPAIWLLKQSF